MSDEKKCGKQFYVRTVRKAFIRQLQGMTSTSENRMAALLQSGKSLLGIYHGYPAEGILETIGAGWDFVWIDGQHGQFSIESALRAVRTAASMRLETILRVPTHDAGILGQYADTAASAVMIPQVDTAEAAAAVVQSLKFPPRGQRSFGGRRPVDVHGRDYYLHSEPVVVVQIESLESLENIESIAAVAGVDALFFGADDLKLSLGLSVETPLCESDALQAARRTIAKTAHAAGKWCGLGVSEPRDLLAALELGYQLVNCGGDVAFLRTGVRHALEQSRSTLEAWQNKANMANDRGQSIESRHA